MKINLSEIRIDGGTQSRVELNQDVVAEYAELYAAGKRMPDVSLFFDGVHYWLADGFHRYFGAKRAGKTAIDAEAKEGSQRDAWLYSLGANDDHGLRRTNADKRKAVLAVFDDEELGVMTARQIAEVCNVSHSFVNKLRDEQESLASGNVSTIKVMSQESHKKEAEANPTESPSAKPAIPEPDPLPQPVMVDLGEDENAAEAEREVTASIEALYRIAEADDKLAEALAALNLQAQQVSHFEKENARLMNENAELRKQCDYWRRKAIKAVPAAA